MRTTMTFILLTANLVSSAALADADYFVQIETDKPRRAQVTARIVSGERGLCFSRSADDTGLTHGWATFVHKLAVNDANGQSVNAEYDGDGCWRLDSNGRVIASYTMLLMHDKFPNRPGDDELAYAGDWGQFWTGRALFIEGKPAREVSVEFSLPQGWAVTAPWPSAGDSGLTFVPPDTDALFDSGFMLGTHQSRQFNQGDAAIHMGLTGTGPLARGDELVAILSTALGAFTDLHEASPVGDLAVFLARGRILGGGVMGQTISILVVDEVSDEFMPTLSYILIHEAFHLWNANLNYANQSDMYWFSEGFAEYFTHLQMQQQGLVDAKTLLGMFEERASLYAATAGQLSMVDAGQQKLDHYDLIYSGGMLAALALDMHVQQSSDGRYHLKDVMPAFYARFGVDSDTRLDLSTFASVIEEQTGADSREILRQHVAGPHVLPTAALIEQLANTF